MHRSPVQLATVACWLTRELHRNGRDPGRAQLWVTPHEAEQLRDWPDYSLVQIDPITFRLKLLGVTVRVIGVVESAAQRQPGA